MPKGLFTPGEDFLVAADSGAMERHVRTLVSDPAYAAALAARGLATVRASHSCAHRVTELLAIVDTLSCQREREEEGGKKPSPAGGRGLGEGGQSP